MHTISTLTMKMGVAQPKAVLLLTELSSDVMCVFGTPNPTKAIHSILITIYNAHWETLAQFSTSTK